MASKAKTKRVTAAKPAAAKRKAKPETKQPVSQEERCKMIAEAAFLCSKERGLPGTDPVGDWLEAEREIDWRLESRAHASH